MSHAANAPEPGPLGKKANAVRMSLASRREVLPARLFGEPAWHILLVLAELDVQDQPARAEELAESIAQPITITLRWLQELLRCGLVTSNAAQGTVQLSEEGARALARALEDFPERVGPA